MRYYNTVTAVFHPTGHENTKVQQQGYDFLGVARHSVHLINPFFFFLVDFEKLGVRGRC